MCGGAVAREVCRRGGLVADDFVSRDLPSECADVEMAITGDEITLRTSWFEWRELRWRSQDRVFAADNACDL